MDIYIFILFIRSGKKSKILNDLITLMTEIHQVLSSCVYVLCVLFASCELTHHFYALKCYYFN